MAQLAAAAVGVWIMSAPAVLGYGGPARTVDVVVGPIAASLGLIAAWEATRGLRWGNVVAGLWLLGAPWLLTYADGAAVASDMLAGALLLGLALLGARVHGRYGGGWAAMLDAGEG
jgi:hypothetical protein